MATVLIVDDSAEARDAVRVLLEDNGYRVTEATDGREALKMLAGEAGNEPCLIVLDLEMPMMSGWELLRVLKNYYRLATIPVLVVTAHERASLPLTGSFVGYLRKPYEAQQLLCEVRKCVPAPGSQRVAPGSPRPG